MPCSLLRVRSPALVDVDFMSRLLSESHANACARSWIILLYEGKLFFRRPNQLRENPSQFRDFLKRRENLRISQNCFRNLTYVSNDFAKVAYLQHDTTSIGRQAGLQNTLALIGET